MIDIHSHILPGIDDGAKTKEESIEIAKIAVENGITKMIATPHYDPGDSCFQEKMNAGLEELNEEFLKEGIPLTLYPGAESFLNGETLAHLKEGRIPALNHTSYLLVEFPLQDLPLKIHDLLYQVQMLGYRPVIAHPERYREVQRNLNFVKEWIERGALIQINATSITGVNGSLPRETAKHLLSHDMVHLIGTDTHSPGNRKPGMKKALGILRKWMGEELTEEMMGNNEKILQGERIFHRSPMEYPRAYGFWKRFKGKLSNS